ncbi:MFS transporter [Nocardioides pyridinolyticus]
MDPRLLLGVRGRLFLSVFLHAAAPNGVVALVAVTMQATGDHGPVRVGLWLLPLTIGTVASAAAVGALPVHVRPTVPIVAGLALVAAGAAAVAADFEWGGANGGYLWFALFLVGIGTGLFMTPGTTMLMLTAREGQRGAVNGIRSSAQNAGSLIGTAVALTLAISQVPAGEIASAFNGSLGEAGPRAVRALHAGAALSALVLAGLAVLACALCWGVRLSGRTTPARPGRSVGTA